MSNIKVFVQWERSSVFAGEDLKCKITFTNAATPSDRSRSISPATPNPTKGSGRERWFSDRPRQGGTQLFQKPALNKLESTRAIGQRHGPILSLNASSGGVQRAVPTSPVAKLSERTAAGSQKHKRSVSIVSIGGMDNEGGDVSHGRSISTSETRRQSLSRHGRAASFHGVPTKVGSLEKKPSIPSAKANGTPELSGSFPHTAPFSRSRLSPHLVERKEVGNDVSTNYSELPKPSKPFTSRIDPLPSSFRFPRSSPSKDKFQNISMPYRPKAHSHIIGESPEKSQEVMNGSYTNRNAMRVLSPVSMNGTPRSSVELYSASNHSGETLASEYVAPIINRQSFRPHHERQPSNLAPIVSRNRPSETLMMGYVQLMGSFTLDGSLVNLAPFEEIKRKGVIGGQGGGGVVGVDTAKRDNGLLGGFSWGNISESLGGLLVGTEPSSMREMKGIASTKSVPIISTPQSILFIDLSLNPGESRSYTYSYALPTGIPPTHKGRAIKVAYHLVIGTQRAQAKSPQHIVRHVDIPFKVLPGVDGRGNILGHDLMSPYIVLQNNARTSSIGNNSDSPASPPQGGQTPSSRDVPEEFTLYVEGLLDRPRQDSNLALLSPTESKPGLQLSGSVSVKEIINFAILRGNSLTSSMISPNRFQIQKAGEQVAVILLARPAYRVGETITAVVDFQGAKVPCHSVHASLETAEVVDPAIALRSSTSIHRATRRVHVERSEYTVCAQRTSFLTTIPVNSTPEFITSGVSLEWKLRFEFVTTLALDPEETQEGLMEEVLEDERGKTLAAVEGLPCESFDVSVPIRVYGTSVGSEEPTTVGGFPI